MDIPTYKTSATLKDVCSENHAMKPFEVLVNATTRAIKDGRKISRIEISAQLANDPSVRKLCGITENYGMFMNIPIAVVPDTTIIYQ